MRLKYVQHRQGPFFNSVVNIHEQSMNHISLNTKGRPRCYVKSPTVQDAFWPIPDVISYAGVTGSWGLLSHAQNVVSWPYPYSRVASGRNSGYKYAKNF